MNKASEIAIQVVRDYISALDEIGVWMGYSFDELSYSRWAATELLKCLEEQQETPPLLVMESFRDRMDEYSHMNQKFGHIFSGARDVTDDIIDCLLL